MRFPAVGEAAARFRRSPNSSVRAPRWPSVEHSLWHAVNIYRFLALAYAVGRYSASFEEYRHPVPGWGYMILLTAWTCGSAVLLLRPARRTWPLLWIDLAVAVTGVVATRYLADPVEVAAGAITLPTVWSASVVIAFAIKGGWRHAALAALIVSASNVFERGRIAESVMHNAALLILSGLAIGFVVELARSSERTLVRALQIEAATRERERLARDIHDGVLQVLAMVRRRGDEIGGEAAELGRLAGEQEVALRALITREHTASVAAFEAGEPSAATRPGRPAGRQPARGRRGAAPEPPRPAPIDLRTLLTPLGGSTVSVAAPGTPVLLPAEHAEQIAAAVQAALDNVRRHVGEDARAWVLLEEDPDLVTVSVRDEGPGIAEGRLAEAAQQGRLGVAQSIRGRIADLGGETLIDSRPGQGTEIEMRVPRPDLPAAPPAPRAGQRATGGRAPRTPELTAHRE
ncbi:MacS family sensor histidine kinase [Allostreptomyces psammosilenae]|uniref:Signal transduction histidine kinase n=1 Tax=Allostreptomyces psammosilenae TaxID=1892865 RepID=A0A852ZXZ2_9ACTN|nr:DUF5931 domain-containing protein [Allostreptomyces psammosilenae]NYI07049.1 signal transduction histidine kinase [Allostreptomyces psammosilenae]